MMNRATLILNLKIPVMRRIIKILSRSQQTIILMISRSFLKRKRKEALKRGQILMKMLLTTKKWTESSERLIREGLKDS